MLRSVVDLLDWIWDWLVGLFEDGDSILLVGPRKSGKSTFFNQLFDLDDNFEYIPTVLATRESYELDLEDSMGVLSVEVIDISGAKFEDPELLQDLVDEATILIFVISASALLLDDTYFQDAMTWAGVLGEMTSDELDVGFIFSHQDILIKNDFTSEDFFHHERLLRFKNKVGYVIDPDCGSLLVNLQDCPQEDLRNFVKDLVGK